MIDEKLVDLILRHRKNCFYTVGNGGSMANAMHLATDFNHLGFRAICLCNPCMLTAMANDYGVEEMFARQISNLGRAGDVLFLFSGSGLSPNICVAAMKARKQGLIPVGITQEHSALKLYCNYIVETKETQMEKVEDFGALFIHELSDVLGWQLGHYLD